ncbi:Alpha/Beta hydrolase protein [Cadophora sp. MPI-SDFR-AT-0126]|nr:Alpha/Beta hydrolase protein [Leotiomycetes sp. MPI-SDFR-AT-0126]
MNTNFLPYLKTFIMRQYILTNLFLFLKLAESAPGVSGNVVNLGYASYHGTQNKTSGVAAWYGIRYAKEPVGELRWRAPVLVDTYVNITAGPQATIDATSPGPSCLQSTPSWTSNTASEEGQSEDCLLLDVLTPIRRVYSKLPVLVQIHGGGYATGNSASLPGDSIVHHGDGGLIFVSLQYRLGPLGFLGGEAVKADGSSNAGLLDQRLALKWVKKYIHRFGGDPDKVTIIGGSAGGGSVTLQMTMYGGVRDPPFRAAIPEYPWWTTMQNNSWLNRQYDRLIDNANCSSLDCLRGLSLSSIRKATTAAAQQAYTAGEYPFGNFYWGPYVDGTIIRDSLINDFRNGHFTRVPVMVDHSLYEGALFSNFLTNTSATLRQEIQNLWPAASSSKVDNILHAYSSINTTALRDGSIFLNVVQDALSTVSDTFVKRQAILGDSYVNCGTMHIATAVRTAGLAAYKMIFNAGYQLHGAVSNYVFSKDINPSGEVYFGSLRFPGNDTLASFLRDYIVNFVILRDPNEAHKKGNFGRPTWPIYSLGDNGVLMVGFEEITSIKDSDLSLRCKAVDEVSDL